MSTNANLLSRLIQDGQLVQDFSSFTDTELRLGAMMMVDNRERVEETTSLFELIGEQFRVERLDAPKQAEEWARAKDVWAAAEEAELSPAEQEKREKEPWNFYRCIGADGKCKNIQDMDRDDLIASMQDSWISFGRAQEASALMVKVLSQIQSGLWHDPRATALVDEAPKAKAKRKGP